MNKNTYSILFGALLFGLLINSVFIVNEKEKAIVFQFGEAAVSYTHLTLPTKLTV